MGGGVIQTRSSFRTVVRSPSYFFAYLTQRMKNADVSDSRYNLFVAVVVADQGMKQTVDDLRMLCERLDVIALARQGLVILERSVESMVCG